MKIRLYLLTVLLCAWGGAFAQQYTTHACDFTGPLYFRNGKTTVILKGRYYDIHESAPHYALNHLEKHQFLLHQRIYSGTDISFGPENCSRVIHAPLVYNGSINLTYLKPGTPVYLTCVVFEGLAGDNTRRFFVVKNISLQSPVNKKPFQKLKWHLQKSGNEFKRS